MIAVRPLLPVSNKFSPSEISGRAFNSVLFDTASGSDNEKVLSDRAVKAADTEVKAFKAACKAMKKSKDRAKGDSFINAYTAARDRLYDALSKTFILAGYPDNTIALAVEPIIHKIQRKLGIHTAEPIIDIMPTIEPEPPLGPTRQP